MDDTPMTDLDFFHRDQATALFNRVWDLMEQPERSVEEIDEMIHAAHASRYHWGRVGSAGNLAIGEWQISRVYSLIGRNEPAVFHGQRSLAIALEHGLPPFLVGCAHEAIARASLLGGDEPEVCRHLQSARANLAQVDDPEERAALEADIDSLS